MIRENFGLGTANARRCHDGLKHLLPMDTLRREGVSDLPRCGRIPYCSPAGGGPAPCISPAFVYYGREVWEQALAALLCGENLLLAGGKATGKNVLAENLAAAFGRPAWDISFHVNMDAASLIGMDTFEGGQVKFRPGPVYRCAQSGGISGVRRSIWQK